MDYLLNAFFGLWLLLSLLVHVSKKCSPAIRRFDRWALIPTWRYFVANAMRHEFSIVTPTTPRTRQLPPSHARRPWSWFFNPGRLDSKAFNDAAYFAFQARDEKMRLLLLAEVSPQPALPDPHSVLRNDRLTGAEEIVDTLRDES